MKSSFNLPATLISRDHANSLVEQIVEYVIARIEDRLLRPGARMPSIRQFADTQKVSRFTVVEAYDRLVARGYLESRRGSGFFVRERSTLMKPMKSGNAAPASGNQIDVVWLVRNMFRQLPPHHMPGLGVLPHDWLDAELVSHGLRSISRLNQNLLLHYGTQQGFLPLRQQLQLKLAELEIAAAPEQIVLTSGVTQGLDLVAREFVQPGETIFVDDPAWFLMFGSFTIMGAKIIGIPRVHDGPDVDKLAELAAIHKPKLYVINSILHNPTSTSISAAKAFQVLRTAEQFNFMVVEDDVYCDLHPGPLVQAATRIAALDQLNRVIYLGSFSKSLAANLRVGFIATSEELAAKLSDRKMLSTLTTTEIGERVVYKILSEGHYRKHTERIRARLDSVRESTIKRLESYGMKIEYRVPAGMFLWVETGQDTNRLTEQFLEHDYLLAPGSLFSPAQRPSSKMRINITTMENPKIWKLFDGAFK